ncbi:uncharacterized protein LOC122826798 [Gambusia affinis]|uniref:uncharacterized protein LOC122826798 n=1 Tax=Gambusia affinis TaxID=33528 RepID=UPI001CDC6E63|nr:uncharacterized protein LOC122826798 [Gambusia affinis]
MILLLGLLCAICVDPAWSHKEDGSFSFEGNIQQDAVANNSVYIATEEKLYQLSHDLTLLHSLTQRGILKDHNGMGDAEFHRISGTDLLNARFNVNILIPFARNDTVVSCGVTNNYCGYCEILDLKNISKLVYNESIQVGPQRSSSGSVSFLVDVKEDSGQTETYILTAIKNPRDKTACSPDLKTINLQNTNHKQNGDIFNWSGRSGGKPGIQTEADVEFVDGFQINSTVYLFSNVASGGKTNKVRLIWLQAETSKTQTLKSLRGATLSSSGGEGSRLLASSVIPGGQQVLWSGVFSVDGGESNTELLLFDISPDLSREMNKDPDFFYTSKIKNSWSGPKNLKPKVVLLNHNDMTSVLAMKKKAWMVFFIGTADGLLMKVCRKILNTADQEAKAVSPPTRNTLGDPEAFPDSRRPGLWGFLQLNMTRKPANGGAQEATWSKTEPTPTDAAAHPVSEAESSHATQEVKFNSRNTIALETPPLEAKTDLDPERAAHNGVGNKQPRTISEKEMINILGHVLVNNSSQAETGLVSGGRRPKGWMTYMKRQAPIKPVTIQDSPNHTEPHCDSHKEACRIYTQSA